MGSSVVRVSLAEERRRQSRRLQFTVREVAEHLGVPTHTVTALIRKLRMNVDGRMTKGQAARLIVRFREQQGDKIFREIDGGRFSSGE